MEETSNKVVFEVPYIAGKQRARATYQGGRVRSYTPSKTREQMEDIAELFIEASSKSHGKVLTASRGNPIAISISTYGKLPKSVPKKVTAQADLFKPDVDNIAKLVLDALNEIAYEDDKQVIGLCVTKNDRRRINHPYMRISITYLGRS